MVHKRNTNSKLSKWPLKFLQSSKSLVSNVYVFGLQENRLNIHKFSRPCSSNESFTTSRSSKESSNDTHISNVQENFTSNIDVHGLQMFRKLHVKNRLTWHLNLHENVYSQKTLFFNCSHEIRVPGLQILTRNPRLCF